MTQSLQNAAYMEIITPVGIFTGGSQDWYPDKWQRRSGCGPTAAANQLWYLARSRPELSRLCEVGKADRDSFVSLQKKLFGFITPGPKGVNRSEMYTEGAKKYFDVQGVKLTPHALDVPGFLKKRRPGADDVRRFVEKALSCDCPVAFLNLSNGNQRRLDSWHWVTILGLDHMTMRTRISDQGKTFDINLADWLRTSLLGGALVYFAR